jgi:hypothetical protein
MSHTARPPGQHEGAVMMADASLAVRWVSVTAYAALGGADFGGGLGTCWPGALTGAAGHAP